MTNRVEEDVPARRLELINKSASPNWAKEYLAAAEVYDFSQDPDDYKVTRQSKATIAGLLIPVSPLDYGKLSDLFTLYTSAFQHYHNGGAQADTPPDLSRLTGVMRSLIEKSTNRYEEEILDFKYISIDPRDYTIFTAPHVDVPVVCIHTRPERCWFLGILKFAGALGLSLGRMRVMRPDDNGMYPVTIRTKWRALTNKVKQEEVRDAYRRLIQD